MKRGQFDKNITKLSVSNNYMRYFYFPYNGEIACIPEWALSENYPHNGEELLELARVWLERNKRGDFGRERKK